MQDRYTLYRGDWFHSLVNSPTHKLIFVLMVSYLSLVVFFAIPYFLISKTISCNMGISNFIEAFMFSLETMATIGFGTQDIFFDDCILPMVVIALQICTKLVADALIIGLLYSRVGRPNTRASTIIFTDKAVIRRIRGKLYFMLQVCELRKHQLIEAHVRLYLVRHNREPEAGGPVNFYQTCTMRLNHPNDELGGMLLLCLPQTIVHEIDVWSPLYPPPVWASAKELHRWTPLAHRPIPADLFPNPSDNSDSNKPTPFVTREVDELFGSESFPATKRYSGDATSPYASQTTRSSYSSTSSPAKPAGAAAAVDSFAEEKAMLRKYMTDRKIEIIAIVEGTDAASGGSVQARHSYTLEDIEWDQSFERCVFEDAEGGAVIDFGKFHETKAVSADAPYSGAIPSHV